MSYVDALFKKDKNTVYVVERKDGQRVYKEYPVTYQFFYSDPKGKYRSIYDEPLSVSRTKTYKDFQTELKIHSSKKIYESDLNQTFVCLSDNYLNIPAPNLNVAFFDIETGMQPYAYSSDHIVTVKHKKTLEEKDIIVYELANFIDKNSFEVYDHIDNKWSTINHCRYLQPGPGYSSTDDACMPITSISVYLQWSNSMICLAIPPKTLSINEAKELVKDIPNVYIFDTEKEMLDTFLDIIEDADILSGWNSCFYDIPYCINRITQVLSKNDTKRLCLWNQSPKSREVEKYGKKQNTYELVGRVHLDYLELYQKYTYEERASYRLDYIGEYEVGENKVAYEGSLEKLYYNDFRKFIEYNIQDTALLNKLDQKLKFINTANTFAHANTVLLPTVLGTVAATEQAIINEAHLLGLRIPNRTKSVNGESTQAAGAYVAYPKKGMHKWVGSLDINSLYPSTIRALNMSPETIIGQLRQDETNAFIKQKMDDGDSFAASWEGKFATFEYDYVMNQDSGKILIIDWHDGTSSELSAAEIYNLIFESNNKLMLSANGTIFTYGKEGIIPGLLKKWYSERKSIQKSLKRYIQLQDGISLPAHFQE